MKRFVLMVILLAIMIGGGLLTLVINEQGAGVIPGVVVQTNNPEASATYMTSQQGLLFFIWSGIVLGGVVSTGAFLALFFWALNRWVAGAKRAPKTGFSFALNASVPNSLGGILARRPSLTIALVVVALVTVSAFMAVVLGAFNTP